MPLDQMVQYEEIQGILKQGNEKFKKYDLSISQNRTIILDGIDTLENADVVDSISVRPYKEGEKRMLPLARDR